MNAEEGTSLHGRGGSSIEIQVENVTKMNCLVSVYGL